MLGPLTFFLGSTYRKFRTILVSVFRITVSRPIQYIFLMHLLQSRNSNQNSLNHISGNCIIHFPLLILRLYIKGKVDHVGWRRRFWIINVIQQKLFVSVKLCSRWKQKEKKSKFEEQKFFQTKLDLQWTAKLYLIRSYRIILRLDLEEKNVKIAINFYLLFHFLILFNNFVIK